MHLEDWRDGYIKGLKQGLFSGVLIGISTVLAVLCLLLFIHFVRFG